MKPTNAPEKISEVQLAYKIGLPVEQTGRARPFLKWAGGKGQLLATLEKFFPQEMRAGTIKKYAEPLIGGGALFFYVAQNYPSIKSFFISDINPELTLAYRTIQADVEGLIPVLADLEERYHSQNPAEQKLFFYEMRETFNKTLPLIDFARFQDAWIERTALIIFLNRTCFNGLFRVNSKGQFNVPFGDYKNPKICDADNLRAVSAVLQKTEIVCADFSSSRSFIDDETFVYFDPPYRPISKTSSFTSYSKHDFGDDEQNRLAEYFRALSTRGAKLMLSNSDPKNENPDDDFFEKAYREFRIERVSAARMINSNAQSRGKIKEIIVTNYHPARHIPSGDEK
jgi:DNA adenine methylase